MEGGCQDPVYNTWQILHMRKRFFDALKIPHEYKQHSTGSGKPVMLLLKRSSNAKHTRNGHDLVRQWSDLFATRLFDALVARFPQYEVKLLSDRDESTMGCHSCLVKRFNEASVLIGMHGAGLGNQIYMRPNG
jgi:hypothetical protein